MRYRLGCVGLLIAVVALTGCVRQDTRLLQHAEAFESLAATTKVIVEAWLSGNLSGTFTRTALEQTHALIERERTTLAGSPRRLIDSRGAALSQEAEALSRVTAALIADVREADAGSSRQHLSALPMQPSSSP
jgi:hypothetical protein